MANRLYPGDELSISSKVYNHAASQYEAASGIKSRPGFISSRPVDSRVTILNNTGQDLPRFSVVQFLYPLLTPAGPEDEESDFFNALVFAISVPADEPLYKWGVTQEAIPNNEYGDCLVSGVTPVKLVIDDGPIEFAIPNGTFSALKQTDCGICRVLWHAEGGNEQWAVVNIG